ncbi:MAG: hypothetical protein JNL97_11075 [Verrucomicrobiales bacterium]|nr:hypothetical protein [Verrucomicrobiales bacterium]
MPDFTLTSEERRRFDQAVRAVRMDPDAAWECEWTLKPGASLADSAVRTLPFRDLASLNAAIGFDDALFRGNTRDRGIRYPAPLAAKAPFPKSMPRSVRFATLAPSEHRQLRRSAEAYLFGDSAKASANEDLLNALHFPMDVRVLAARSLTLDEEAVLTLEGPLHVLILGSLILHKGAQLVAHTDLVVHTQLAYSEND